jgi:hypothetical protein
MIALLTLFLELIIGVYFVKTTVANELRQIVIRKYLESPKLNE